MGYILGKAEGDNNLCHGHVTAVTVSPEYRRLGVAKKLMKELEEISNTIYNGYFVDLFVRQSNSLAIKMYEGLGYVVYRRVLGYYSGLDEEDAFGNHLSFLFLLVILCILIDNNSLNRYEKSITSRYNKIFNDTTTSSYHTRSIGMVGMVIVRLVVRRSKRRRRSKIVVRFKK